MNKSSYQEIEYTEKLQDKGKQLRGDFCVFWWEAGLESIIQTGREEICFLVYCNPVNQQSLILGVSRYGLNTFCRVFNDEIKLSSNNTIATILLQRFRHF